MKLSHRTKEPHKIVSTPQVKFQFNKSVIQSFVTCRSHSSNIQATPAKQKDPDYDKSPGSPNFSEHKRNSSLCIPFINVNPRKLHMQMASNSYYAGFLQQIKKCRDPNFVAGIIEHE